MQKRAKPNDDRPNSRLHNKVGKTIKSKSAEETKLLICSSAPKTAYLKTATKSRTKTKSDTKAATKYSKSAGKASTKATSFISMPFIPKQTKQMLWLSVITCVIIAAYFAIHEQMRRFPITTVKINGQIQRTSKQDVWAATANLLNKGFFGVNVGIIRTNLMQLPWIEKVQVEKVWPDKIAITIQEKVPVARWRGKGLVTTTGDIVYADSLSETDKLPVFWGSENQVKKMLESYLLINDTVKKNEMSVAEIEIMPDHGIRAILNNGIMLFLGQEGLPERLNRFNLAYRNKLQKMYRNIDYVDLRYVNGIAVGWKDSISKIYTDQFLDEDKKLNA